MHASVATSALSLALALCLAPHIATARTHDHGAHHAHDAPAAAAQVPADHVRWQPDAPLVAGMARVRTAMDSLAHHEMGHLDDASVLALAGEIDAAIDDMFANCRLAPEPDAALHGVLARLMSGSRALREAPADAAPVAGMRAALDDYARLFDDDADAAPPAH